MLKYLFTSVHQDGTIYRQNQEDVSISNPEKSSFYDVLQLNESGNLLQEFTLSDGSTNYLVNLNDGHFEINGVKFNLHDSDLSYSNRRLIYFRRTTLSWGQGFGFIGEGVLYKLGWQGNDHNGSNAQFVIEFY